MEECDCILCRIASKYTSNARAGINSRIVLILSVTVHIKNTRVSTLGLWLWINDNCSHAEYRGNHDKNMN